MIKINVEQGSLEWFQARMGIPTASMYGKILTPKTLKLSESSKKYRNFLLAEWLCGEPLGDELGGLVERGADLEERAFSLYEAQHDVDVERPGFVLRDDKRTGCSPDGLIEPNGGLEMKCPAPGTHMGYLLDLEGDEYRAQVQGGIWICEREWWDFYSYHPLLPKAEMRIARDDAYIGALSNAVLHFCDQLDEAKARLMEMGHNPKLPEPVASGAMDRELPAWVWG